MGGIFATCSARSCGWGWGVPPMLNFEDCGCEAAVSLLGSVALVGVPCRLGRLIDLVCIGWGIRTFFGSDLLRVGEEVVAGLLLAATSGGGGLPICLLGLLIGL